MNIPNAHDDDFITAHAECEIDDKHTTIHFALRVMNPDELLEAGKNWLTSIVSLSGKKQK